MNHYSYGDLTVGHTESFTVTVKQEDVDRFREITGDVNPLHADKEYARAHGHEECVVFGMLTASYLSTLAGVYLPGEKSLIHSVTTKFKNPVYVGDTLTIEGKIAEMNDTFKLLIVKVEIKNQHGKKVMKGEMQIGIVE